MGAVTHAGQRQVQATQRKLEGQRAGQGMGSYHFAGMAAQGKENDPGKVEEKRQVVADTR